LHSAGHGAAPGILPGALFHRIISHLWPWHGNRTAGIALLRAT